MKDVEQRIAVAESLLRQISSDWAYEVKDVSGKACCEMIEHNVLAIKNFLDCKNNDAKESFLRGQISNIDDWYWIGQKFNCVSIPFGKWELVSFSPLTCKVRLREWSWEGSWENFKLNFAKQ